MSTPMPDNPSWKLETTPVHCNTFDLHNHVQEQGNPGAVQLRRRFVTVSIRFYIEIIRGTYYPPRKASTGPQQLSELGPGGKI